MEKHIGGWVGAPYPVGMVALNQDSHDKSPDGRHIMPAFGTSPDGDGSCE